MRQYIPFPSRCDSVYDNPQKTSSRRRRRRCPVQCAMEWLHYHNCCNFISGTETIREMAFHWEYFGWSTKRLTDRLYYVYFIYVSASRVVVVAAAVTETS